MSDHRPLKTSFKTNVYKRGDEAYLKLNNSYVSDENCHKGIQIMINEINEFNSKMGIFQSKNSRIFN